MEVEGEKEDEQRNEGEDEKPSERWNEHCLWNLGWTMSEEELAPGGYSRRRETRGLSYMSLFRASNLEVPSPHRFRPRRRVSDHRHHFVVATFFRIAFPEKRIGSTGE